ncbi:MAG: phasin family protein [Pontibacterium sp.]
MYEDLMKEMKEKMQPFMTMSEINKTAAEKIFTLQSEYFTDFVNSSVEQLKALTEVKDPKALMEFQLAYAKTLESKMTSVAEEEMAAISEAQEKISAIIEKSLEEVGSADYFAEVSKYINDLTEAANKYMTDAAASVEAPAPAPAKKAPAKAAAPRKAPAKKAPAKAAAE